ncbi:hypothetical protein T459_25082 [Capsicum annuum]|uniref:Uncharacterized protein n=1 Tax=Capsicum annuum TaxID=4072 RepID=A0A2G2YJQ7_CAPAN|nr:hypothetical protein T459_25082 [Capsicum annuum]
MLAGCSSSLLSPRHRLRRETSAQFQACKFPSMSTQRLDLPCSFARKILQGPRLLGHGGGTYNLGFHPFVVKRQFFVAFKLKQWMLASDGLSFTSTPDNEMDTRQFWLAALPSDLSLVTCSCE